MQIKFGTTTVVPYDLREHLKTGPSQIYGYNDFSTSSFVHGSPLRKIAEEENLLLLTTSLELPLMELGL